jgi:hypothetical protein
VCFWIKWLKIPFIPKVQPTRCYVSQCIYFNKMLHMFQAVPQPIIRSSNFTYSFCYLSELVATCCYHGWVWTSSIPNMIAAGSSKVWRIPDAVCAVWTPVDGLRNRLKHVENFTELNELRNVASCWLHFGNILRMHGIMNIKDHSVPIASTLLVQSQEGKEGQFHNGSYTNLSSHTLITASYTEVGHIGWRARSSHKKRNYNLLLVLSFLLPRISRRTFSNISFCPTSFT